MTHFQQNIDECGFCQISGHIVLDGSVAFSIINSEREIVVTDYFVLR